MAAPGPTSSLLQPPSPRTSTPSPDLNLYRSQPEDETESINYPNNEAPCIPGLLRFLLSPWKSLFNALYCCNGPGPGGGSTNSSTIGSNTAHYDSASSPYSLRIISLSSIRPSLIADLFSCPPFFSAPTTPPVSPLLTNEPDGYFSRPRRNTPTYNPAGDTPGSYYTTDSPRSPPDPSHPYYQHYHPHFSSALYTRDPEQLTPGLTSHFLPGTYTAGTSAAGTRANPSVNTSAQTSQTDLLVMYGHGYDAGTQRMIYRRIVDSRGGRRGGGEAGSGSGLPGSIRSRGGMMIPGWERTHRQATSSSSAAAAETTRREDRERAYEGDYDGEDATGSSTVPSSDDGDIDADYDRASYNRNYPYHHHPRRRKRWVWAGSEEDEDEYDDEGEGYDNDSNDARLRNDDERPLLARRGDTHTSTEAWDGTTPRQGGMRMHSGHGQTERERPRGYGSNDNTPRPGAQGMMGGIDVNGAEGVSDLDISGV